MFVIFTLGAFTLFAPIVILPLIKDHCELLAEETRLLRVNGELEKEVARQDALVEAFQKDATINERLAVLDLHYNNPAEETVRVVPSDFAVMPSEVAAEPKYQSALKIPEDWPARVRRWEFWAEERGLISLFLDPTLRTVFLLMAAGLIISAFVLFAPRIHPESVRVIQSDSASPDESLEARTA